MLFMTLDNEYLLHMNIIFIFLIFFQPVLFRTKTQVYRPGQQHPKVFVYRIVVEGPEEEECLDGYLVRRNTDKETIGMAVSSAN